MEPHDIHLFRLATIYATTDNFSDSKKLGQGGFGPVYKGTLPDGREVAIKRLSSSSDQGSEEFMNEALLIMRLQHKNLVRLLGCCIEGGEKILVYEYMPNSSLDVVLLDPKTRAQLHWRRRFNIIVGIARGILYLHEDSRLRIIHRDLKPSNVLLDQEMNSKISDFGIARIFGGSSGERNTARIVGTYGYMAPEYAMNGLYSTKSDAFSFGVILLEIVTGRKNAGFRWSKHALNLLDFAWQLWREGRGLELMDPLLAETYCTSEFLRCINVGLLCVQEDAIDRPTMSNVVVMLRSESLPLPEPKKPAFSVSRITPMMTDEISVNWLTVTDVTPLCLLIFSAIAANANGFKVEVLSRMARSLRLLKKLIKIGGLRRSWSMDRTATAWCVPRGNRMGSFKGHILPGTLFLFVSVWHIWSAVVRHVENPKSFRILHLLGMSKTFHFILLYFLLAVLHNPCDADAPYPFCSNSTANDTLGSLFQNNLNHLFSSSSSNASLSIFNNFTIGNETNRVYGLYLCLGFDTIVQCKNCVDMAVQDISRLCPNREEATVWEEYCLLRYSNQSFFGHSDDTGILPLWNNQTISNPDQFSHVVRELLNNLSSSTVSDPSTGLYATGEANLTIDETVYGLVQCTRDLSGNECLECLRNATNEILSCCYFYRGARLLSKSCYIRYELYAFYEGATEAMPLPPSTTGASNQTKKISTKILSISLVSACVAVAFLGFSVYCLVVKGRKEIIVPETPAYDTGSPNSTDGFLNYVVPGSEEMEPHDIPLFRLATIHETTHHFSDSKKLGQGGFGLVFKGTLPDGREVAIKRLSISSDQGLEEFMNEVLLIMRLQHKNLVKLLGCCIEEGEKILVYEYMPNSSLDVVLFDPRTRATLDWRRRFNIIVGIARGILYLHEDSRLRIIHRDLKPSNVLLDQEMNPKISDFGMARIFGGSDSEKNTIRIVGTYGYMAPEFAMEGLYSTMSDVYSFGVILLEIVTGSRNAGFDRSKNASSLLDYAWQLWSEGKGLELMDPLLTETNCSSEFLRCINVGLLCVQEDAIDRPTMSNVVVMLKNESLSLPQPRKPAFSVGRVAPLMIDDFSVNWLTVTPR
ncbi:cysteine-rich receptor-like protein kinase 10 [Telopea speciosissima]|uniref:cysteine-rich receptor-like protein kinase 10 n=1 Tax=Telopea speciosissima TaxID=54955 RepID=UPI001CC6FF93|nr:cysteine-rich receptor-like protein kinase 10 [Telopea speciosissima]